MVSLSLGTIGPLLPRLAGDTRSGLFAGLVIAGHPIGSLLAAIPTALASRRIGLSRVIVAGASIGFVSSIFFVWPGAGWWIVLARIGYGACGTIVWQSVFSWAITNSGPGRRARTTGTLMAASTAGGLVAPELGALADHVGLWLCAVPPALLLVAASRFALLPAYEMLERPDPAQLRAILASRQGLGGAALTAGFAVIALGVAVSLPLLLDERGVSAFGIGTVQTLAAAAMIALNPLAGRLIDHGHTAQLVAGAFAGLTLALLGFALAPSAGLSVVLSFATVCLSAIPNLAGSVLSSRATARANVDQTISQTLTTLAWAPAAITGSIAAGMLPSPTAALLVLAGAAGLGAAVLGLVLTQRRRVVAV